ncbi:MAG: SMC family ATPase [Nitrososphaeraceae archaeon]
MRTLEVTNPKLINFPQGRILFRGDIGSGKSTILSAIEFALFGLGDMDANHLLRVGESKGTIFLEFQNEGKDYGIFRSLNRKGSKIVQNEGLLYENGIKQSYSVGELKSKILQIIKINEKAQAKSTSVLYRFAIYSPQEMMKQILSSNIDKRMEILRRAFGIEEYSIAKTNAEKLFSWIRLSTKLKSEIINELEELELIFKKVENHRDILNEQLELLSKKLSSLNAELASISRLIAKKSDSKDKILKMESYIIILKSDLQRNEEFRSNLINENAKLSSELLMMEASERKMNKLKPSYEDGLRWRRELTIVSKKMLEYEKLNIEKLSLENLIENKKSRFELELSHHEAIMEGLNQQITTERSKLENKGEMERKEIDLSHDVSNLNETRNTSEEVSKKITATSSEINSIKNEVEENRKELDRISALKNMNTCPYCDQTLNAKHILTIRNRLNHKLSISSKRCNLLYNDFHYYEENRSYLKNQVKILEDKNRELVFIQLSLSQLTSNIKTIENLEKKIDREMAELIEITSLLHDGSFASDEKKKLELLSNQFDVLEPAKRQYDKLNQLVLEFQVNNIESEYLENFHIAKSKSLILKKIQDTTTEIEDLDVKIMKMSHEVSMKKGEYLRQQNLIQEISQLQSDKTKLEKEFLMTKEEEAVVKAELNQIAVRIQEINAKIETNTKKKKEFIYLEKIGIWLNEFFLSSIDEIESAVMSTIREEFNQLFKKWFYLLIETNDAEVEIDEFFSPIVYQYGKALDVLSLSGGEKTSISLAYRLALNEIIKRIANIGDHLLILDEPTDGFSKEQLTQLKLVLESLEVSQLILVSHEKELESFVDWIYVVSKYGESSKVEISSKIEMSS